MELVGVKYECGSTNQLQRRRSDQFRPTIIYSTLLLTILNMGLALNGSDQTATNRPTPKMRQYATSYCGVNGIT